VVPRALTLLLASRSPQRRAILEAIGVPFRAIDLDVEELETGPAEEVALTNARRKASAGGEHARPGETVIAVDTVVTLDDRIWGKPGSDDEARQTLRALSGRTHEVVSGIVVGEREGVERTRVTFHDLDEAAIDWYAASGEWRGRAGGYAIQGRGGVLVARIEGDYLNVVGLPVGRLAQLCGGFAAFLANGT
jgi:septum formation protein